MKLKINQQGFTIVELLVVIVVIAILVALTLPNLFGLQRRARDDARKNDLKNIQQALETYFNDNSAYPSGDMAAAGTVLAGGDYIASIPSDPQGDAYTYTPGSCTGSACQSYTLAADLENDNDPAATSGVYTINSVNQP